MLETLYGCPMLETRHGCPMPETLYGYPMLETLWILYAPQGGKGSDYDDNYVYNLYIHHSQ
jgi:hypothetical protein